MWVAMTSQGQYEQEGMREAGRSDNEMDGDKTNHCIIPVFSADKQRE